MAKRMNPRSTGKFHEVYSLLKLMKKIKTVMTLKH